ncbi:hypothetical protein GKS28_18295 [Bacillus paralicheniformis]|uniref:hypothetical protein n=1 Tax=Bacillus TaxID=1386 RepID=UPI0011518B2A|nr:hypothetical protein [Bacillus paralicheniformis]MSO00722.1 hypothetical protein [Bacillus paralicheniformis]MSO04730.1 hypothetical protein [Bacillus paralicheniformis]MSO08723.1 hypothetical protein [Bacillus paralicheniformis]MSO12717.1 hypothetical protein [Bacillus paralicheniformis]NJE38972.1 hypothetical protein [Bacillus paralicheniformis]
MKGDGEMDSRTAGEKEPTLVKAFHYITLAGIILLIIPSGLNPVYLNVGFILFGLNIGVRSFVLLKKNKKGECIFTIAACLFLIGYSAVRLYFLSQ